MTVLGLNNASEKFGGRVTSEHLGQLTGNVPHVIHALVSAVQSPDNSSHSALL